MADEQSDQPEQPISKEPDVLPGFGLTPVYSNRFYLWANDQIMRFVIGDSVSGKDLEYKFSFVMTRTDAAEMAMTIIKLLASTKPADQPKPDEPKD